MATYIVRFFSYKKKKHLFIVILSAKTINILFCNITALLLSFYAVEVETKIGLYVLRNNVNITANTLNGRNERHRMSPTWSQHQSYMNSAIHYDHAFLWIAWTKGWTSPQQFDRAPGQFDGQNPSRTKANACIHCFSVNIVLDECAAYITEYYEHYNCVGFFLPTSSQCRCVCISERKRFVFMSCSIFCLFFYYGSFRSRWPERVTVSSNVGNRIFYSCDLWGVLGQEEEAKEEAEEDMLDIRSLGFILKCGSQRVRYSLYDVWHIRRIYVPRIFD